MLEQTYLYSGEVLKSLYRRGIILGCVILETDRVYISYMAIAVCTPVMAAEITTTEDAVIENSPEVAAGSLESVGLEEISPMSLSEEQYDVLSDDEIQTYGTTPDDYEENDSPTTAFPYSKVETLTTQVTSNND